VKFPKSCCSGVKGLTSNGADNFSALVAASSAARPFRTNELPEMSQLSNQYPSLFQHPSARIRRFHISEARWRLRRVRYSVLRKMALDAHKEFVETTYLPRSQSIGPIPESGPFLRSILRSTLRSTLRPRLYASDANAVHSPCPWKKDFLLEPLHRFIVNFIHALGESCSESQLSSWLCHVFAFFPELERSYRIIP
jgi:hypothetical protein